MTIIIGFLTFILALIAAFLILLVLVQLPKKEAGVGMAFGAGMSEMLLGAGSGNVLTRITKYTVGAFLVLSLMVSVMVSGQNRKNSLGVTQAIEEKARTAPRPSEPAAAPSNPGLQSLPPASPGVTVTPPLVTTTTVVNPTTPALAPAPATTPAATPAAPAAVVTPSAPAATNKPAGN